MANLNAWQKIDRVLPGRPFGDGVSGAATISADNTLSTVTATADSTSATVGSTSFANGDIVLLHQTQHATASGQWEINRVSSGGGTTSLVFQVANKYTYAAGAQIVKVPRYTTATIGSFSQTAWNGTTGGLTVVCANTSIAGSGTITGTGKGFRGGNDVEAANPRGGQQGEGYLGVGVYSTYLGEGVVPNGNGGGGGMKDSDSTSGAPGGGGGNGAAGGLGGNADNVKGQGGLVGSSADCVTIRPGGGGGGGRNDAGSSGEGEAGVGGAGGGILILIGKSIAGSTATFGGNVGLNSAVKAAGGGGAGGAILVICQTATSGTFTANGGAGGTTPSPTTDYGGAGGAGAIAIHHSGTVSITTTPTFTNVTDGSLYETGGAFLFNLI